MATIIKNRQLREDSWQLLEAPAGGRMPAIPLEGDVIVPLELWMGEREALLARKARVGVWLQGSEDPERIAADLAHLPLVAIHFPKLVDGRGYSIARLLRERHGYRGELRAIGDVQRDQLLFLSRCGFDAFALKQGADPQAALSAFAEFSETYQASADSALPLFRRRATAAESAERS
ncbi:MAG: DUF934 domain-containing protein [Betaproteobacteria bacterium]